MARSSPAFAEGREEEASGAQIPGQIPKTADAGSLSQRGVVYVAARYGCSTLINLGNVFILTWWIGPRAYGTFVTAVGVTTFLSSMARAGLDTHLVRSEEAPDRKDYDTAFTLILFVSLALCAVGGLALPWLIQWLRSSSVALPYLALLVTVPMIGLAGLPMAKLERDLRFGEVARIELGGQVAAFVAGATLAWRGLGVWAPVTGHVAWQLFVLVVATRVSGVSARLSIAPLTLDRVRAWRMFGFGLGFSASVRVWQLRKLVNPLIVGRLLGTEAVAFVALATRSVEALSIVRTAVERVAIAGLARLREDPGRCQQMMQKGARLDVLVLGPAILLMSTLGPALLPRLFGERWSSALVVLPFVAAGALVNSVFALEASALFVEGRQWVVTRAYVWHITILILGTAALTLVTGIAGYGWAELAACFPYVMLHRWLRPELRIALVPILPWLLAFICALFSASVPGSHARMRWVLWLPLGLVVVREVSGWVAQRGRNFVMLRRSTALGD